MKANPPDTARIVLAAAVGVAGSIILGLSANYPNRWSLPIALVATLSIYWAFSRAFGARLGALALLILMAALDAFEFRAGPAFIRGEQIAAVVGIAVVVISRVSTKRWWIPSPIELVLIAWFGINILSSILAAPDLGRSMKILALMVASSAGLFIPRRLNLGTNEVTEAIRVQLVVFAGVAAYGLIALAAHSFLHSTFGLTFNRITHQLVASGSMWESNAFGDYCAAGVIAWALLGSRWFGWKWASGGLALCLCAALVSFTRAAWLSLAVIGLIIAIGHLRRRVDYRSVLAATTLTVPVIVVFGIAQAAGTFAATGGPHRPDQALAYTAPATPVASLPPEPSPSSSPSVSPSAGPTPPNPMPNVTGIVTNPSDLVGRFEQLKAVLYDWRRHPLLGGGTASYGQRYQVQGMQLWIASLPLRIINDTGLIGLISFGAFILVVAVAAWQIRRTVIGAALGLILLLIFLTNLSTESLELMYTWLFVGLMLAARQASTEAG